MPGYSLVSIPYNAPEACLLSADRCWAFSKITGLFFLSTAGSDQLPTRWAAVIQWFGEEKAFISLLTCKKEIWVLCKYFWLFPEGPFPDGAGPLPSPSPSSLEKARKVAEGRRRKHQGRKTSTAEEERGWRSRCRAGKPGSWGDEKMSVGWGWIRWGTPGTPASLAGDAYQAAKLQGEGSLQAGEVFEVGGEPLETSSLPNSALHCGHLPLSAFLLFFFFPSNCVLNCFCRARGPRRGGGTNPNKVKQQHIVCDCQQGIPSLSCA